MRRWGGCVLAVIVALLGPGCAGPEPPTARPPVSGIRNAPGAEPWRALRLDAGGSGDVWWPMARVTEMRPTGIEVVVRPPVRAMVVDGAGDAWLHGQGWVARVDPRTGSADVWDPADDVVFADVLGIRATQRAGVWLVLRDRLLLFDGRVFVRDLPVAESVIGPDGVADMVEVGSEVWVAGHHGVLRCDGRGWAPVDGDHLVRVERLAVDGLGTVWADGRLRAPPRGRGVVRLLRNRWDQPFPHDLPRNVTEMVADPDGGVVVSTERGVAHFDGSGWTWLVGGDQAGEEEEPARGSLHMGGGRVWLTAHAALLRHQAGGWQAVAAPAEPGLVAAAEVSGDLVVADSIGLLRLRGDRLERIWADSTSPMASRLLGQAFPAHGEERWSWLSALPVSAEELWVTIPPGSVMRVIGEAWEDVLLDPRRDDTDLVLATDGYIWSVGARGLLRHDGPEPTVVDAGATAHVLRAGQDGSVWVLPSPWGADGSPDLEVDEIQHVHADGTREVVRLPAPAWALWGLETGSDGSLWIVLDPGSGTGSGYTSSPPSLLRWTGAWTPVPYPGAAVHLAGVAADGSLWATLDDGTGEQVVARHDEGQWQRHPQIEDWWGTVLAPDGSLCGIDPGALALTCLAPGGAESSTPLGVGGELGLGRDGSVWVTDHGLVMRLPATVR